MICCGIDPSLSCTGVVVSDPDRGPEAYLLREFKSKSLGDDVRQRMMRFEELIGRINTFLEDCGVTHVFLESYSFSSKFNVTLLAEFGGLLRWHLMQYEVVKEVAPTTLKKFVTGAGNTKGKDLFVGHVVKRYGVMLGSSDSYDAYGLWRLGRCCLAIDECDNDAQREAVAKVMGVELPKVKKRKLPKPAKYIPADVHNYPAPESYF